MIQQPTTPPALYRVECKAGRPKLISNIVAEGYTAWCQQCRMPRLVEWSDLPTDVLRGIMESINQVLVARNEQRV